MAKLKKDLYVNRAIQRLTQSAPNALTFQQINFAVGVFQGIALVIHQVKYHIGYLAYHELLTNAEAFQFGLTVSSQIGDLNMTHIEVIDRHERIMSLTGVAANATVIDPVAISDFTQLPAGGILIPANPLYIACGSMGLTTAVNVDCEVLFTFKELADADYIELIQSRVQSNL